MTALETTGDLVSFKGQMIRREDIPRSNRVRPVALQTMDDALRYAKVLAASSMLPKSFYDSANGDPTAMAFVAIQLGAEVGLSPMASVQNIAVINGKPGLYGPAMLAVVEASGMMETFAEWIEGDGESLIAYCRVKRFGRPERVVSFSWGDAKKANLTAKRGPWAEYPKRMMQARARSFALRDVFPDILAGLSQSVEELQDIPNETRAAIDVTPPPPPPPVKPLPPIKVKVPGGWDPVQFSQEDGLEAALEEALEFMLGAVCDGGPAVVAMNNQLLDRIAEKVPAMAERVAGLRASAAEALAPKDDPDLNADDPDHHDDDDDDFPGDRLSKYAEPLPGS